MTVCTWIATRAVTKPVAPAPSPSHPNKSVSPPPPDRWNARALLRARRDDWGIESTFHQRLDTTLDEDRSRVRTPNAAHALGLFRRLGGQRGPRVAGAGAKEKIPGQPADVCHRTARAQCPARPEPRHRHRPTSWETILKPPCEKSASAENNCPALRVR